MFRPNPSQNDSIFNRGGTPLTGAFLGHKYETETNQLENAGGESDSLGIDHETKDPKLRAAKAHFQILKEVDLGKLSEADHDIFRQNYGEFLEERGASNRTLLEQSISLLDKGLDFKRKFEARCRLIKWLLKMEPQQDLFLKEGILLSAIRLKQKNFVLFFLQDFWHLASKTLENNKTCLHGAFEELVECVEFLIRKSVDIVTAKDNKGNTLLHIAVKFRQDWGGSISQKEVVEHLIEASGDAALLLLNNDKQSAYQYRLGTFPHDYKPPQGPEEADTIEFLLKNAYMHLERRQTIRCLYGDRQGKSKIQKKLRDSKVCSNLNFQSRTPNRV